jgi:hypothetical protein
MQTHRIKVASSSASLKIERFTEKSFDRLVLMVSEVFVQTGRVFSQSSTTVIFCILHRLWVIRIDLTNVTIYVRDMSTTFGPLRALLEFSICSFNYKKIQKLTPGYLYERLRFGFSQRTEVLIPPRHNHTLYGNSFFVEGVSLWNSLQLEVRSSCSLEAFKWSYSSHASVRQ